MVTDNDNLKALAQLALDWYERKVRDAVEPDRVGDFVVINLDTGEFEVDASDVAANRRAQARFPSARLFMLRVGRGPAYRIGGTARKRES